MKKILTLALAATMLIALAACGSSHDRIDVNTDTQIDNANYDNTGDDVTISKEKGNYIITDIGTGYNEGLMFVQINDPETTAMACIDKSGNIVFEVEVGNIGSSIAVPCGFHNGLAVLDTYIDQQREYKLCDKTGKIITAEDLDADSFIFDDNAIKAFKDGYIFTKKTTTSFNGSVDELAIFNAELEKIVDFSEDLYDKYINYGNSNYYDGYLFSDFKDNYIDLRTGTIYDDISKLQSKLILKNKSDFWIDAYKYNYETANNEEEYYIFDYLEKLFSDERDPIVTPIVDLSEYKETAKIQSVNALGYTGYADGTAGLLFTVSDSEVGNRYYFTILDETGKFCFEPIETQGFVKSVKYENGVYALLEHPNIHDNKVFNIEVYDKSGKTANKEYIVPEDTNVSYVAHELSDSVIYVHISAGVKKIPIVDILTTDLQPLF